jgi:hypothetical protein
MLLAGVLSQVTQLSPEGSRPLVFGGVWAWDEHAQDTCLPSMRVVSGPCHRSCRSKMACASMHLRQICACPSALSKESPSVLANRADNPTTPPATLCAVLLAHSPWRVHLQAFCDQVHVAVEVMQTNIA